MKDKTRKIARIRTGGQSGVDRAAMDFAREYGIPLCGWCPKNGWAEDHPEPPGLLADFPEFQETPSSGTEQRTRWNMRDADAILTIMPKGSAESKGTEVGLEEGEHLGKPMFTAAGPEDIPELLRWIQSLPDGIELCVGGPRASECPEAYGVAKVILQSLTEYMSRRKSKIEELLQCPYWIIDILPAQVPKDSLGQYFAIEDYYLQDARLAEIKQKHVNLVLKVNCYRDISIDEEDVLNPSPERIAEEMRKRYLFIMVGNSMILSEPDDTHLTVFNPDPELLELIQAIASGEGLYVWKGQ